MKGIVLKTIPYQETGKIVLLFSDEEGLISALVKRLSPKNTHLQNLLSPLAYSEFQLAKRKSTLYQWEDATLLDPFLPLRRKLEALSSAQKILHLILKTQPEGRPSLPLFRLTLSYLTGMKNGYAPHNYPLSYACKLLRLEGLFPLEKHDLPIPLNEKEWETVYKLAYATSHEDIVETNKVPGLEEKILSSSLTWMHQH